MNPDFFTSFVLQRIDGRREITFSLSDALGVAPALRAFVVSRLAWVTALTGVVFTEVAAPGAFLSIVRGPLPDGLPGDGLTRTSDTEHTITVTTTPEAGNNRAQFVLAHELGHGLGLAHPQGDALNPVFSNSVTLLSAYRASIFTPFRTTWSPLDVAHLQQAHGTGGDRIIGTAEADRLSGNAAPNVLYGLGGPDRLRGREGADWLHGGGGQDTFILDRPSGLPFDYDVIEDFGRRDVVLLRGMNPERVRVTRSLDDALLTYRGQPLASLPGAGRFFDPATHLAA